MAVVAAAGLAASFTGTPAGAADRTAPLPASGFNEPAAVQAETALTARTAAALGIAAGEKLHPRGVVKDPDGTEFVHYDRTYNGLKVVGGDLIIKRKGATIAGVTYNRGAKNIGVASTKPTLTQAAALSKGAKAAEFKATSTKGALIVFAATGKPVLAYEVVTTGVKADQTPSVLHTFVDARSGAVLAQDDEIKTGTGNSMYSGTVFIGTSGSFTMSDPTRGGSHTTDLNGATSGTGTTFTDPDDTWGSGTTANRQTAGVDAHFGAQLTWDYYKNVHGRSGIFNNGQGARSRVHYGNAYVNAFWDGTQMTYGDGAGNARPLTSIDVAGHEMSHGVTEATADLNYFGDAGGLNESTSDIFGTAVEFSANNSSDPGDYLIGEKININGNGTPLRYMDKPSKDGRSYDCWSSAVSGADPHYSSGPLNHWFYLASEGTGSKVIGGVTHASTACNGATITPVGRDVAAKVWYRTLTTKLTSGSTYRDAREGAINSAKELYGPDSAQCKGIEAAFSAISVPAGAAACGGTEPEPPTGTNRLLNPGFESGAVNWTGTTGVITNSTSKPARTGSYKAWLQGNGRSSTENLGQSVAIPATATAASLSFWIRIDTAETTASTVYDTVKVQIVDGATTTTLGTLSNLNKSSSYVQKTFSVTQYKGKTVTVRFVGQEDASLQTSFVIDDVSLVAG
ncbi:Bacillolysin [Kribbella flavida DSM 17836]|uniref:Neutral metalloproteinase n=1 Tax=Kribbella flavida (strain DSM 17836 / JCM 10339 / NBRC 14399) TaxID=479435 RepID=D2PND2_KRIFD|nr:M4 family metallopeptidase [Kribbella flavida]ADB34616.1 Bacillolysin [Kribbella flavida DSM 17836]